MRVVIVGGGFGGIKTALGLAGQAGIEAHLISDREYLEYHAALYRSATGRSPMEVAIPLWELFKNIRGVQIDIDRIISIDDQRKVITGSSNSHYRYDILVLAVGSVTQYFGIKGLDEHSYGVKTIHEALELKRHLHEELAEKPGGITNYVVVGGGATGVELAAELAAYLKRIRKNHHLGNRSFKVMLVEATDRLMPALPRSFTKRITKRLKRLKVDVRFKTAVMGENPRSLALPEGSIKSHSVVWTAGVANNPLFTTHKHLFKFGRGQKVKVNRHLLATKDIFVIGDSADTPFSGMAQTALRDADLVAVNIIRRARRKPQLPYRPREPVYAIPVGPGWSAVYIHGLQIFGYLGWLVRRWSDLMLYRKFLPWSKAFRVWRYSYEITETCPECD